MKIRLEIENSFAGIAKFIIDTGDEVLFVLTVLEISFGHLTKERGIGEKIRAADRAIAYDLLLNRPDDIARLIESNIAEVWIARLKSEQCSVEIEPFLTKNFFVQGSAGEHVIAIVENDGAILVDILNALKACADRPGQNFGNDFDFGFGKKFVDCFIDSMFVDMLFQYDESDRYSSSIELNLRMGGG